MGMNNDDINKSDLTAAAAAAGDPSNSEMKQEEITGIRIRRFRMYCAIKKNLRTQSQFKYRANSVMVDKVGLAELAEQKMKEKLPRIAKAKARDIYNGLKLVSEYMALNDSSDYSEQLKRISKNMSDGVLTKKNLRDAFMRQYQDQEHPATDCGYSLDFLLGFSDDLTVTPSTDGGYSLDFLLSFSDDLTVTETQPYHCQII